MSKSYAEAHQLVAARQQYPNSRIKVRFDVLGKKVETEQEPDRVANHRDPDVFSRGPSGRKEAHLKQAHSDQHHAAHIPKLPLVKFYTLSLTRPCAAKRK